MSWAEILSLAGNVCEVGGTISFVFVAYLMWGSKYMEQMVDATKANGRWYFGWVSRLRTQRSVEPPPILRGPGMGSPPSPEVRLPPAVETEVRTFHGGTDSDYKAR